MPRWKSIPQCPGLEASEDGQIRRGEKILKQWQDDRGYWRLSVYDNGKMINRLVHRLILSAFKGQSERHCAHNDGDPSNNNISNLRWATAKQNCEDKKKHGTEKIYTHCKRGHEFTRENTRWGKTKRGTPKKTCLKCAKAYAHKYYLSRRETWNDYKKEQA